MAYGDYSGPDKPTKGHEAGACNRQRCQAEPAVWYNHGSASWYCEDCRNDIQFDSFNLRDWEANYQPRYGHPMFETRGMMLRREQGETCRQMLAADLYIGSPHDWPDSAWSGGDSRCRRCPVHVGSVYDDEQGCRPPLWMRAAEQEAAKWSAAA